MSSKKILFWLFWDIGTLVALWWFVPSEWYTLILGVGAGIHSVGYRVLDHDRRRL